MVMIYRVQYIKHNGEYGYLAQQFDNLADAKECARYMNIDYGHQAKYVAVTEVADTYTGGDIPAAVRKW